MRLTAGQEIELAIDKPVPGGRMMARHEGQVVLVLGAVPGEHVVARIERVDKRLAFARTVRVTDPSPDRRDVAGDPLCGGCVFAHIAYPRQVTIKAEVIADAFARIGRMPLEAPVIVEASPEHGYRMRARLHVADVQAGSGPGIRSGRQAAGFYREGSHQLCDAAATGQLLPAALEAVSAALAVLGAGGTTGRAIAAVVVSENIAGDRRALHFEPSPGVSLSERDLEAVTAASGVIGCTARTSEGVLIATGDPRIADPLSSLTSGRAPHGDLCRSPESFFQGNRHLIARLVTSVLDAVPAEGDVLDLYAGVGLFSIALAGTGRQGITAVEGDRSSGGDLRRNAAVFADAVRPIIGRVEDHLRRRGAAVRQAQAPAVIVDPPRTGLSREALEAIVRSGPRRTVYVSCDPPTMARDARRLLDSGYRLASLHGFDLFPNTPHVEVVGVFDARS